MILLKKLYRRYEALSPIYRGSLTNHLPMLLTALHKMGVDKETITIKCDQYRDEKGILDLTQVQTPITDFEQTYINLTSQFLGELNNRGTDIVVGEFLSKHRKMFVSGLFHGLIRLAYAKESKEPLLIAQALAYYECISEEVVVESKYIDKDTAFKQFELLREKFLSSGFEFEKSATMERLQEVIHHDLVKGKIYKIRNVKREDILEFVLYFYLKTKNFYVLHLITGLEAMFELEEYLFEFDEILNDFFVFAQLFILFGEDQEVVSSNQSMKELVARVTELEDAHDIKLLYSLSKLNKMFDQPLILLTANTIYQND